MTWTEKLKDMRPCDDAVAWLESTGLSDQAAWDACERADWMLWLAARCDIDRRVLVRAACACARTALAYVTKGEDRPRIAIETAERWCDGRATIDDVRAHAAAAADAADAAHAAAAAKVRLTALRDMAAIVRQHIPQCPLKEDEQ